MQSHIQPHVIFNSFGRGMTEAIKVITNYLIPYFILGARAVRPYNIWSETTMFEHHGAAETANADETVIA